MFEDLLSKMGDMKKDMAAQKERLDSVRLRAEAADEKIVIIIDGNRQVRDISIHPSLLSDHEELEDFLSIAFNRAIEKANALNESEMGDLAKTFLPPGMMS
jgi:DNA-binding YbaB/EbfC family protein